MKSPFKISEWKSSLYRMRQIEWTLLIGLYIVVCYKMHSNKEEWRCCDFCVIILCFIYVHNPIIPISDAADAHIIYGSSPLLTNIRI